MTTPPDPEVAKARARKLRRYAIAAGVLLAIVCKFVPTDYQAPCSAVVQLCTGGL